MSFLISFSRKFTQEWARSQATLFLSCVFALLFQTGAAVNPPVVARHRSFTKRTNRLARDQPLSNEEPALRVEANLFRAFPWTPLPVSHCSETEPDPLWTGRRPSPSKAVYHTSATRELIYERLRGGRGERERKSPLLIITVEDDVCCCLSMFRINFRWTNKINKIWGVSMSLFSKLISDLFPPSPSRFAKTWVRWPLTYTSHFTSGERPSAPCANSGSFVWIQHSHVHRSLLPGYEQKNGLR